MNVGNKTGFCFLLMLFFLNISCSSLRKGPSLAPEDYLKWYGSAENRWFSQDTVNDLVFKMKLYPKEVNIARCALDHCESKETLLTDLKKEESVTSFFLEVKALKGGKEDLFSPAAQMNATDKALYLSNGIKKELFAFSSGKDTIFCNSVIYEPAIPGKIRLLVDFNNPDHQTITRILFNDNSFTMTPMEFLLLLPDHQNFPTLNLKNYE
jgi:hypothetical protein